MLMEREDSIVEVRDAYKSHDGQKAILQGLNMTVKKGSIFSLLGPSGCGKTTLLKCIVGRNVLDAGKITLGISLRSQLGYMPQEIALVGDISIKETLSYYGWMYDLTGAVLEERKKDLFQTLDIPSENKLIKNLSGGQKRRVSLCLALLHTPSLMLLDEPTVGADPLLRDRIWKLLVELSFLKKKTIILTTHYLEEARKSNRVGMMREGVLLAEGNPKSLMEQYNCKTLEGVFINCSYEQKSKGEKLVSQVKKNIPYFNELNSPLYNEKTFSMNNLMAYLLKSFYSLKYSSFGWFLLLIIPISTCTIFEYSMGRDPVNLKFGVVNDELFGKLDCNMFSNVTCFPASCLFLDILKTKINIKHYSKYETAYRETYKNHIWGFLHFSQNFTEFSYKRAMMNQHADENILDQSKISTLMYMSNQFMSDILKKDIIMSYFEFLDELSSKCNWPVKYMRIPIHYKSIHGTNQLNFGEFSITGLLVLLEFCLPVTFVLAFLKDKREGILERSIISGTTVLELLAGHTIVTMSMFVVQTFCNMFILYTIYEHTFEGNTFLALTLVLLIGISGLCFGLTIVSLFDRETTATFFIFGSFIPVSLLSGMFWPTEGMHYLLRSVSWLLPLTLAAEAYRSITMRSWSLSHPVVYSGFLSVTLWIIIFSSAAYSLMKRKSGIASK